MAYDDIKLFDRAIENYNQAIKLRPSFASAYNNRGIAYKRKGEYARAIEDYDKALAIDPKVKYAAENRADALKLLNK